MCAGLRSMWSDLTCDGRTAKLTPNQEKAIERIQLAGVVLLIGVVITMRVLARSDVINEG
jgi:hypothetical protein